MKIWLIWMQGDDHTWLETAWDDESTAENHEGWREAVDKARKLAYEEKYEMRIQAIEVPGVYELFEIPTVQARVDRCLPPAFDPSEGSKEHRAITQAWVESEKGWGVRPDGSSLHLTEQDREKFIKEYWDGMPDETPDVYCRPEGQPRGCLIDDETYSKLLIATNDGEYGIRI